MSNTLKFVLWNVGLVLVTSVGTWAGLRLWRASVSEPTAHPPARTVADDAQLQQGRLVYQTYCVSCHGHAGLGDGPAAADLKTSPGDFTKLVWKHGTERDAVKALVAVGLPATGMPAFGSALSPSDLEAVVSYSLSLRPADKTLEALLRSAGFKPLPLSRNAPVTEWVDASGARKSLADYKGKVVLLKFWGTQCPPCLAELPDVTKLSTTYAEQGLVVVPICVDTDSPAEAEKVASRRTENFPIYLDPTGRTSISYNITGIPKSVLIDRTGKLLAISEGAKRWDTPAMRSLWQEVLRP